MRFVGAAVLARPKKPRRAKGTPPPDVGLSQPDPAPPLRILAESPAFGTRVTIVLMLAVYRTRVPSRGPGESIERSWRPRAKSIVAKDQSHDALGWRHGVGLLEKYSRPCGLLIFRRRHRGAEFPPGNRFWDTRHDSPSLSGYRGVPSRDCEIFARRKPNPNPQRDSEGCNVNVPMRSHFPTP